MSELWAHQQRVTDLLADGRNVVLQAPTGSGKTRAALDHFLYELARDRPIPRFPRRCIYSVPMRVLAKQFYREYDERVESLNRQFSLKLQARVKTQTGEQSDDPQLTANLIFATIDQTLSSYLLAPYSLGRSRANVNAGAVMSSYLVFDEFHLFDPVSTLPTTLQMLRTLKGIAPFVLMTATFSETLLGELGQLLDAVIVPGNEQERAALDTLESQQKERAYQVNDHPLSAEAVWEAHGWRSLVICNTVDRARRLHRRLQEIASPETEVLLLHSQFLSNDRNAIEDRIRQLFGKQGERDTGSAIVVATQAIEVGVDMSCETLHTELAPANAIIQRAGRCARYKGEKGTVHIYSKIQLDGQEDDLSDGKHYLPYESQKNLFQPTLEAFRERQGRLTFADEQAILSQVHNRDDTRMMAELKQSSNNYQRNIFAVQRGDKSEQVRNLIRDVRQTKLIIHPDPVGMLSVMTDSPLLLPAFGLHPGSVQGYLKGWQERAEQAGLPWSVLSLVEFEEKEKKKADEERPQPTMDERFKWVPVQTAADVTYAPLVVVNPALATYDPQRGLLPDEGGDWQTPLPEPSGEPKMGALYTYRLETYADHIRHVHQAFVKLWPELEWAAARLEERFQWQPGCIQRAAELAVFLHDVGKLSEGWQGWVREYQQQIADADHNPAMQVQPGQAYAHTESTTPRHKQIEKKMRGRPWHAVEGAISALPILSDLICDDSLLKAATAAIARHHAPFSDEHQPYRLIRQARERMAEAFAGTGYTPDFSKAVDNAERVAIRDFLPMPGETEDRGAGFMAYLLLVRALRRADAAGTQAGNKRL